MRGGNTEKTHMNAKRSEEAQTKAEQHAQHSGSSSKAHAPNIAVINYAESSIVRFLPSTSSSSSDHRKILRRGGRLELQAVIFFLPPLTPVLHLCHACVWLFEHI